MTDKRDDAARPPVTASTSEGKTAELRALQRRNAELTDTLLALRAQLADAKGRAHGHQSEVEMQRATVAHDAAAHDAWQALKESEARFRMLAENIAQLAWMADETGHVFWYNKRWFDYTGTTFEEMLDSGWQRVLHPEHRKRVTDKIRHCFATGEAWEDLFPLRGKHGGYRWFLSRAQPICDDQGAVVRWFGTNTDVTEQRKAEMELREADRRKDEYIAMLGHELRNPLAAIRNASDLLVEQGGTDPTQKRALEVLQRRTAHMARIIDGLLEVSRIARGKIDLDRHPMDLRETLEHVVRDLEPSARDKGLTLNLAVPETALWIDGDAVRLSQVLENLIGNGIKFTPSPGTVQVRAESCDGRVEVRIRDTGPGIEPQVLSRMFLPFVQGAQEVSRSTGGLGLGLALAKGLVELHGGTITARSEAGESEGGAEFCVLLPGVPAPEQAPDETSTTGANLRILIVEDNTDAATMLRFLLQNRGHRVAVAARGMAGMALLQREHFDVVLCDLGLPDMSGHDFAQSVRAQSELDDVALVAVTGYGQAADRQRSLAAGFDAHLAKPVDMEVLATTLAEVTR